MVSIMSFSAFVSVQYSNRIHNTHVEHSWKEIIPRTESAAHILGQNILNFTYRKPK